MSIIGTRPPLISETNFYELHHRARLAIKPGITGMWQVSGRSDITDFEEVVRLDKEYITNWNIGLCQCIRLINVNDSFRKEPDAGKPQVRILRGAYDRKGCVYSTYEISIVPGQTGCL